MTGRRHYNNKKGFRKAVTPVKTGVQRQYKWGKEMDSGFRRNDGRTYFLTF